MRQFKRFSGLDFKLIRSFLNFVPKDIAPEWDTAATQLEKYKRQGWLDLQTLRRKGLFTSPVENFPKYCKRLIVEGILEQRQVEYLNRRKEPVSKKMWRLKQDMSTFLQVHNSLRDQEVDVSRKQLSEFYRLLNLGKKNPKKLLEEKAKLREAHVKEKKGFANGAIGTDYARAVQDNKSVKVLRHDLVFYRKMIAVYTARVKRTEELIRHSKKGGKNAR